jgi:phage terminase large subunit-like protein
MERPCVERIESMAEITEGLKKFKELKKEYQATLVNRKIDHYEPYGWQQDFMTATATNKQVSLIAANRVGKTMTGCALLTYCLTGEYPDDYMGIKFKGPIMAVACGVTGEQIRDVLQLELTGPLDLRSGEFEGGGLIPPFKFGGYITSTGTRNLLKEIKIRHKDGGWSTLRFRSYEQGPSVIKGSSYDFILIDEEPYHKPLDFYAECLARTATGNKKKGGLTVLTFTPENGVTELVDMLLNNPRPGQWVKTVGWDMAPHLTPDTKEQLLQAIPRHMVEAKTKGIPTFGDSQVFRVKEEDVMVPPMPIPEHFRVICGIDFGINHPFAAVFVAHDLDRDILYVYDTIKIKDAVPTVHTHLINAKCSQIRVVYPHDANNREKGSGETLRTFYVNAGLNMFRQFHNPDNSISVEPGIMELETRMMEGRLKIFSNLDDFLDEFRKYHRDLRSGRIHKANDDLMDAFRYAAIMAPRFAERKQDVGTEDLGFNLYPTMDI